MTRHGLRDRTRIKTCMVIKTKTSKCARAGIEEESEEEEKTTKKGVLHDFIISVVRFYHDCDLHCSQTTV